MDFKKLIFYTQLQKNTLYRGYRWNFVEANEDPNVSLVKETIVSHAQSIVGTIIQLNDTKTEILDSFCTKAYAAKKLGIGKTRMRKIITDKTIINNCYYLEFHNCPKDLLDKYNKPINKLITNNSKQIKQINPITGEIVIFNSLLELNIKLGFTRIPIKNAIENKTMWSGYIWEYNN